METLVQVRGGLLFKEGVGGEGWEWAGRAGSGQGGGEMRRFTLHCDQVTVAAALPFSTWLQFQFQGRVKLDCKSAGGQPNARPARTPHQSSAPVHQAEQRGLSLSFFPIPHPLPHQSIALCIKQSLPFPFPNPAPCPPQVAWQSLSEPGGGYHTRNAPPPAAACAAALLTTERCLLVDPRLRVIAAASIAPDLGLPVSCLWVGPALLVSTSCNQVRSSCDMPAALAVLCCDVLCVRCCAVPVRPSAAAA